MVATNENNAPMSPSLRSESTPQNREEPSLPVTYTGNNLCIRVLVNVLQAICMALVAAILAPLIVALMISCFVGIFLAFGFVMYLFLAPFAILFDFESPVCTYVGGVLCNTWWVLAIWTTVFVLIPAIIWGITISIKQQYRLSSSVTTEKITMTINV